VKEHERKFVIAGALLAVVSLLLKEVVREDVKDIRDSLSGAKNMFLMRFYFLSLHREILGLGTT
jgi:hypothetical protein